jgi:hypothetical protein
MSGRAVAHRALCVDLGPREGPANPPDGVGSQNATDSLTGPSKPRPP